MAQHGVLYYLAAGLPIAPPLVLANVPPPAYSAVLLAAQEPESPVKPAVMLQSVPKAFLVMIPGERVGDAFRIRMLHAVNVYRPSAVEMTP
jgi:hypothetical protein